jgi:5-formyltetrahydrofolate cyclo-ligase
MGERADNPKARLRRELDARRRSLATGELARAAIEVCGVVLRSGPWREARHVVLYAARPLEVDPRPLEEAARTAGAGVYYPRGEGEGLGFRRAGRDELVPGRFGVPEPRVEAPGIDPGASDVVIVVPGLGFDRLGGRLGTGHGYYDRALPARPRATRIGLTLEALLLDCIPTDPWDVPMHAVATERQLFLVGPRAGVHRGDHTWTC